MIIKPTPIAAFAAVIMLSGPASAWQETAHPSIGTLQTGGSGVQTYTNPQSAGTLSGVTFPEEGTTYVPVDPSWGGIHPGYGKVHPSGMGTTWTTIEPAPAPAGTGYETITVVPAYGAGTTKNLSIRGDDGGSRITIGESGDPLSLILRGRHTRRSSGGPTWSPGRMPGSFLFTKILVSLLKSQYLFDFYNF